MFGVSHPRMPTSPLEPTSALDPPPLFSHPMASAVRPPRQLAPTVGQLEVLSGSMLQTGLYSDSDEPVTLADDIIEALTTKKDTSVIFWAEQFFFLSYL